MSRAVSGAPMSHGISVHNSLVTRCLNTQRSLWPRGGARISHKHCKHHPDNITHNHTPHLLAVNQFLWCKMPPPPLWCDMINVTITMVSQSVTDQELTICYNTSHNSQSVGSKRDNFSAHWPGMIIAGLWLVSQENTGPWLVSVWWWWCDHIEVLWCHDYDSHGLLIETNTTPYSV